MAISRSLKPVGIIRSVDALGRFVIPKEIRDQLGIEHGSKLEVFATESGIFVSLYDKPECKIESVSRPWDVEEVLP